LGLKKKRQKNWLGAAKNRKRGLFEGHRGKKKKNRRKESRADLENKKGNQGSRGKLESIKRGGTN